MSQCLSQSSTEEVQALVPAAHGNEGSLRRDDDLIASFEWTWSPGIRGSVTADPFAAYCQHSAGITPL